MVNINDMLNASFINIDKPSGPTSFETVEFIKKILQVSKTSHSGTLDPKVTGVLVVGIGRAARLLRFLPSDKEYVGVMWLHEDFPEEELKKVAKKFIGKIKQIPPKRSAVKRIEREREIYSFEILEKEGKKVLFKVHCEAGTYIRKLIHDLGEQIKVGAHMLELRRTKVGQFDEKDSVTLYQLQEAYDEYKKGNSEKLLKIFYPIEIITKYLPSFEIKEDSIKRILTGSPVFKGFLKNEEKIKDLKIGSFIALMYNLKLVGVARIVHEGMMIAVPEVVLN
ncbi:MAG: RNA-guided pseudouridylation complex pseudouridine synthase subunit Cbf5 [Candidatus Pacearchaeota archaeon]